MKLKGSFSFMGTETSKSRDGKETYYKLGLSQGLSSRIFYVDADTFKKYDVIPVGSPVEATINITERDGKTYFALDDLQVVTLAGVQRKIS